jgi:hypothetical protein
MAWDRSVARIKDIRDNLTGSSPRFAQLTGLFFFSRCHVITNRHGVSVLPKARGGGYLLPEQHPARTGERPVPDFTQSPVGRVSANVEFGRATGERTVVPARVIYAEAMQGENDLDGDLAILRLDAAATGAQSPSFVALDDLRRADNCAFTATTLGYPVIPAAGPALRGAAPGAQAMGGLLVADLHCQQRACAIGSKTCDDAILAVPGYTRALVTTCLATEGSSGGPLYVQDLKGRLVAAGLVTKTVSPSQPNSTESSWGLAIVRGFTQAELERLRSIVRADITENKLTGCE